MNLSTTEYSKLLREFCLPLDISIKLEKYYVLHWELTYVLTQSRQNKYVLTHYGIEYIILLDPRYNFWQTFSPQGNPSQKVLLSFRKPSESKHGFVIVKPDTKEYK